eukprot:Tamp_23910.p1 GENE.Tamp_23910~~Tamp_23910.p1  ORF type:complete len:212 (-),score=30.89 Tamp_23910:377-949(-)
MLVCTSCSGDACAYSLNRGGYRTSTCCLCAHLSGWSGFTARACAPCRVQHQSTAAPAPAAADVGAEMISSLRAGSTLDFGSAVRELRRARELRSQMKEDGVGSSFKEAYELQRKRRLLSDFDESLAHPADQQPSAPIITIEQPCQPEEGKCGPGFLDRERSGAGTPTKAAQVTPLQPIAGNSQRFAALNC